MKEKRLNNAQKMAVTHGEGPLLIIAGAGTGKTTVITERVKHLVSSGLATPSEILALTFTEKAATEMETRIDEALPYGYTQMWVTTFHGFCDRVLKNDGIHIGLDPKYRLMSTADSLSLMKRSLYSLGLDYFAPLGNPTKFLYGLLAHFSRLQDENVTPLEYMQWAYGFQRKSHKNEIEKLEAKKWLELSNAFKKYEELKIENSLFDFGDLITKTILLFVKRPNVMREYQKQFKFILVDEFQDTNYAQSKLVTLLSEKSGNITVVGDDDQSIYRFRGAAVSNMIQFRAHFPNTKTVTLIENYRSAQKILDVAHTLISYNNPDRLEVLEKINKKLVAKSTKKGHIEFSIANSSWDEAEFVTSKILELKKQHDFAFSDFAILVRANTHALQFVRNFESSGVPCQFLGPGKLFLETEIQDLISYLRVVNDIHNNGALYRLLLCDIFKLDPISIAKISSLSRRENKFLFDLLSDSEISLSEENKITLGKLLTQINDHVKRSMYESAGKLLLEFINKNGMKESLFTEDSPESVAKAQNIEKFFSKIRGFETNERQGVAAVVDWIELQTEVGESPASSEIDWENEDKVNILTVHSAKGLEFPVVFLVNLVSLRFPSMERREQIPIPEELIAEILPSGDFHLQEERRLFYVGVTRAKEYLFLTSAKFYGDGKREKKVSPFVLEALGDVGSVQKQQKTLKEPIEFNTTKVKKSEKINKLKLKSISYSQIETFKVCPLHYKLNYLLKVPSPASPSQSFGISFHNTLKKFYEEIKQGENPSKEKLLKILTKEWIRDGYTSLAHNDKSFQKAVGFLDYYLNNWFEPQNRPLATEQPFSFKLKSLYVKGTIDRIDKTKTGIHIIDYKTGSNVLSQKETNTNLQLSIYALAATKIPEDPFNRSPSEITLSLLYFDGKEIVTTRRTNKQLKEAEEQILDWAKQIEESDFTCSGNFLCGNCEYKSFCATSVNSTN